MTVGNAARVQHLTSCQRGFSVRDSLLLYCGNKFDSGQPESCRKLLGLRVIAAPTTQFLRWLDEHVFLDPGSGLVAVWSLCCQRTAVATIELDDLVGASTPVSVDVFFYA